MTAAPEAHPRRVLLAVSGLSPQVVTETVYALAVRREPAFVPTEVRLLTTAEGAERARLSLLGRDPGWFGRLCRDYGLARIEFSEERIHVLRDAEGRPMADIRTEAENRAAADEVTEWVRRLTAQPETALHVSLAGGRKTLGYFAGAALSLFGRPQDRLSHVLVAAPFEGHPGFYYPTPERSVIYTMAPDSRPLDTCTAEVTLAEIPFVRLRDQLPPAVRERGSPYAEAVAEAQRGLEAPRVELREGGELRLGGVKVKLPPAEAAFYLWLADRRRRGLEPVRCPSDGAPDEAMAREYMAAHRETGGAGDRTARALARGMDKQFFLERRSRTNRRLREALGTRADPYLVQARGRRTETRYGVAVAAERIRKEGE